MYGIEIRYKNKRFIIKVQQARDDSGYTCVAENIEQVAAALYHLFDGHESLVHCPLCTSSPSTAVYCEVCGKRAKKRVRNPYHLVSAIHRQFLLVTCNRHKRVGKDARPQYDPITGRKR